jgi:hypothetical protein
VGLTALILRLEIAASLPSLSIPNTDKYKALFLNLVGLHTSINWCTHSQAVDVATITYKAPNQQVSTVINPSVMPFFLDTGVSVHISNCEADFLWLCPITPHTIRGVGGSTVQALGVGTIHLIVTKGIHITLDNVLFVPTVTVHLISVLALTSSLKCITHFTDSICWVTSANGSCILLGTLTAHHLYAISSGQFTIGHAFMVTFIPTLEIWHRHLGHANYCAVSDLHAQSCSAGTLGMHTCSSSAPSSCEHCILGKQTRSSVPKVKQGVRACKKLGIVLVNLLEHPDHVSSSGNHYVLNIIDDFSSFCWAIPLGVKSDTFNTLHICELTCEADTGL